MARIEPTAAWRAMNAAARAPAVHRPDGMGFEEFVALMCASLTPEAIANGDGASKWFSAMSQDELRRLEDYLVADPGAHCSERTPAACPEFNAAGASTDHVICSADGCVVILTEQPASESDADFRARVTQLVFGSTHSAHLRVDGSVPEFPNEPWLIQPASRLSVA